MILEVDKKTDWLLNKRIKALKRAKRKAQDIEFKMLWEIQLIELLRNRRNKLSIH